MISVKEARTKTEISIAARNAEILIEIEERIDKAIREGKTFIYLDNIIIENSVADYLKEFGYKVEFCDCQYNDCWTKISW